LTRNLLATVVVVSGACSAPPETHAIDTSTLRVSTSRGLAPISATVTSGATRHLIDLVLVPARAQFESIAPVAAGWRLIPRKGSSAAELANKIRHERLRSVTVVDEAIDVELAPGPDPSLADFLLDIGPFQQDSFEPGRLVLHRRVPGDIRVIEVLAVGSEDEEWRRFLAREVDLIPHLSSGAMEYLREVPSVRIVRYERRRPIALHFGLTSPTLGDSGVRRSVAARLNRTAIALYATGQANNAIATRSQANERPLSGSVRLIFPKAALDQRKAALVVEQQLVEMGFTVSLEPLDIPQLMAAVENQSFDVFIFEGSHEPRHHQRFTTGSDFNITKYSNAAYDDAVQRGDAAIATQILETDMPLTPLYMEAEAVAVDRRFCGVRPVASHDYSFLAEIRPCAEGETE
jgi:hypothetical protein